MSQEENKEALYRYTWVEGYDYPADIFALDYYEPGAQGKDDFSRKEAWFYYMGDEELKEEFTERVDNLLNDLFLDNTVDWDYFTLAPSSQKDSLNANMLHISKAISRKGGIEYRQILRRSKGVDRSHEMESVRQRIIDQKDSIEVMEDVRGDNIIILHNISVSGAYLVYCTQLLLEAGAERVCCVCLGVTNHERSVKRLEKGVTASTAIGGDRDGRNE